MCRPVFISGAFAVLFIATAYSQQFKIIYPTYRPPPSPSNYPIRIARDAGDEPQPPNRDGSPLPSIMDHVSLDPNKRYVRSLSTPSSSNGRAYGQSKSSRGHDTGPTHPGYNRRNAREVKGDFIPWPSTHVSPSTYDDGSLDSSLSHAGSISVPGVLSRGDNQRKTRSLHLPTLPPFNPPFNPRPKPWNPPTFPLPGPQRPRFPIYA